MNPNPIPTQIYTIPTPNPIPLHMIPNPESNPDSDSDSSLESDSGFGIAPGLVCPLYRPLLTHRNELGYLDCYSAEAQGSGWACVAG